MDFARGCGALFGSSISFEINKMVVDFTLVDKTPQEFLSVIYKIFSKMHFINMKHYDYETMIPGRIY